MLDNLSNVMTGAESPLANLVPITPHNTNNLVAVMRGLYVGVSGNVAIETYGGQTITLTNLVAGVFHPVIYKKVLITGTTATGIIGGY